MTTISPLLRYLIDRSREASSWRGIVMALAGAWATAHPAHAEALIALGVALSGALGTFLPDVIGRPSEIDQ